MFTRFHCAIHPCLAVCSWFLAASGCIIAAAQTSSVIELPNTHSSGAAIVWSRLVVTPDAATAYGGLVRTPEILAWNENTGLRQIPGTQGKTLLDVRSDGQQLLVSQDVFGPESLIDPATGQIMALPPREPPEGYRSESVRSQGFMGNGRLIRLQITNPLNFVSNAARPSILNPVDMSEESTPSQSPTNLSSVQVGARIFLSRGTSRRLMGRGWDSLWFTDEEGFNQEVRPYPIYASLRNAALSENGRWAACVTQGRIGQNRFGNSVGDLIDLGSPTPNLTKLSQLPNTSQSFAGHGEFGLSCVLNDGTVLGSVQGSGPDYSDQRTACVWHPAGARVRLVDALQEHFGIIIPELELQSVVDASPDGTQILVFGTSVSQPSRRIYRLIKLPAPLPWQPGIPKLWAFWALQAGNASLPVKFSPLLPDYFSTSTFMTLMNTGDAALEITHTEIVGPQAEKFSFTLPQELRALPVAAELLPNIRYTATGPGTDTATLRIHSNDPAAPLLSIQLVAEGPAPTLSLSAASNPLVFGAAVGRAVDSIITLRNYGNRTATGIASELVTGGSGEFSLVSLPPETLAPGTTASFTIRCIAQSAGDKSCQLLVSSQTPGSNLPALNITVQAHVPSMVDFQDSTGAPVNLLQEQLIFGKATIQNDISVERSFYVHNPGTEELTGLTFRREGTSSGEFTFTVSNFSNDSYFGATDRIPAGGRLFVNVAFRPSQNGTRAARFIIDSAGYFSQGLEIQLTGEGVVRAAPAFLTSPDSEINTVTLHKARFRVTGASPIYYRIVKNNAGAGIFDWKIASYENEISLNLAANGQDYDKDMAIELRNSFGTVISPIFRRIVVSLPPSEVVTLPSNKWPKDPNFQPPHFSVIGTQRANYQWFKEGVSLSPSGTGLVLNLTTVTPAEAGNYTCRVSLPLIAGGETSVLLGPVQVRVIGLPLIQPFTLRDAAALEYVFLTLRASEDASTPTKFKVSGLPPGVTLRSSLQPDLAGHILPTAAAKVPKEYRIKVQAENAVGLGPIYETNWRILPYESKIFGTYHATIGRHAWETSSQLSGFTTTTITQSGSYTSQITFDGATQRRVGRVRNATPHSSAPQSPQNLLVMSTDDVSLIDNTYTSKRHPRLSLEMIFQGDNLDGSLGSFDIHRALWGCKARPAPVRLLKTDRIARHHFALRMLDAPQEVGGGNSCYLAASLSLSGASQFAVRMPDGVSFTAASGIGRRSDTTSWIVPFHQVGYSQKGSITGRLFFPDDETLSRVEIDWHKAAPASNFMDVPIPIIHSISLHGEGSHYLAATTSNPWQQAFDLGLAGANATCSFKGGAPILETVGRLKLASNGAITAPSPQTAPLTGLRATWAPTTGLFTINSALSIPQPGTTPKTVGSLSGQALWIPHLRSAIGNFIFTRTPAAPPPSTGWIYLAPVSSSSSTN